MTQVKISKDAFDAAPSADSKPPEKPEARQAEIPDILASELGAETIADVVAGDFPKPQAEGFDATPKPRDTTGQEFDPSKHKMDEGGKPSLNSDGKFIRRYTKRGGKTEEDEYDATATMLASGLFQLFGAVFDAEEAKPSPEFEAKLTDAYASALRAKGISITDPTWNAVGLTGIYGFGVIQKPKSREKAGMIWAGLKARFSGRKEAQKLSGIDGGSP